ncbi:Bacterial transcriptional regulator [compost metagenome]
MRCIAAGIYDDQGKLIAGLSISAPADRIDEGWLPRLQSTAAEISMSLGFAGWRSTEGMPASSTSITG